MYDSDNTTSCSCNQTSTSKPSTAVVHIDKPIAYPNDQIKPVEGKQLLDHIYASTICPIPSTSDQPRVDYFKKYTPDPKTVSDYDVIQDDVKMARKTSTGYQVVHVQSTTSRITPITESYTRGICSCKTQTDRSKATTISKSVMVDQTLPSTPTENLKKTPSSVKTMATTVSKNMLYEQEQLLDRLHTSKILNIPATGEPTIDAFDRLRPKPKTVSDYEIVQTDMKIMRHAPSGIEQFHIQETTADYTLFPPGYVPPEDEALKQQKQRYGTGKGPCWVFTEEIIAKKIAIAQAKYLNQLKIFIAHMRKKERMVFKTEHDAMMLRIGPAWFQELSENQWEAVDHLKTAILLDVKRNSIYSTQDIVIQLGLVPPPKPRQIRKAISRCCRCPVEFLLILYQIIGKNKRKTYSLNDRLLLSAVVHLTLRETLKELHIRIPSPPGNVKKLPPNDNRPKRRKLKIPLKETRRSKKDNSPYLQEFTFVPEPPKFVGVYHNKQVQWPESPYFSYLKELNNKVYTKEAIKQNKKNVNPTVLLTNRQLGITREQDEEIMAELRLAQLTYNNYLNSDDPPLLFKPSIYIPCDHMSRSAGGGRETGERNEASTPDETQTNMSISVNVKVTTDFDEFSKPVRKVCDYDIQFNEETVPRRSGTADCSDDPFEDEVDKSERVEEKGMNSSRENSAEDGRRSSSDSKKRKSKKCPCKDMQEQADEAAKKDEDKWRTEAATKSTKECPCNVSVVERRRRLDAQDDVDKEVKEEVKDFSCLCKEEMEKLINRPLCQCDKCKADREKVESKQPSCNCLQKYREKVRTFEEIKKKFDEQRKLILANKFLMFGGEQEGESEAGKNKSRGSGSREIETRASSSDRDELLTIEDCRCMKIYKEYFDKHTPCIQAYKEFMRKIEIDTKEYMDEIAADERYRVQEEPEEVVEPLKTPTPPTPPITKASKCPCTKGSPTDGGTRPEYSQGFGAPSPTCCQMYSDQLQRAPTCCQHTDHELEVETNVKIRLELNMDCSDEDYTKTCTCFEDHDSVNTEEFVCPCMEDDESVDIEADVASEFKRFTVLEKLPETHEERLAVLKKTLDGMAADGYPLAKLPDVEELHIFKLWLYMRIKKYWTQADRIPMQESSKEWWRHLDYCQRKPKKPELEVSHEEAHKYTWGDSTAVKRMVQLSKEDFYRKVREAHIEDGREFFPSMFTYELPCSSFRRCYFAYVAGKPVDCLASGFG